MSYNYLAWNPDVEITPVFMKKPASGTSPISGGALLKAGTPLSSSKAVANTSNAKYLVAEDYIFYDDPGQNRDPVKLISAGYVDLAKAEEAWGKSYTDDAIAALGEAGITLVDGAVLPSGGGGLPEVTADDNGDVLTVVSGEWAKAAPSGGGGALIVNITGSGDKIVVYTADKTAGEIKTALQSGVPVVIPYEMEQDGTTFYMLGYVGTGTTDFQFDNEAVFAYGSGSYILGLGPAYFGAVQPIYLFATTEADYPTSAS